MACRDFEQSKFQLKLLGSFALIGPDEVRIDVKSRKSRALIALLATAPNGERSRSWLQAMLWSEKEKQLAQSCLRKELWSLRKSVPDNTPHLIVANWDSVVLDLASVSIDIHEAISGQLGEFLEGLDLKDAEEFEDWLRFNREKYRQTPVVRSVAEDRSGSDAISTSNADSFDVLERLISNNFVVGIFPNAIPPTSNAECVISELFFVTLIDTSLAFENCEIIDFRITGHTSGSIDGPKPPHAYLQASLVPTGSEILLTVRLVSSITGETLVQRSLIVMSGQINREAARALSAMSYSFFFEMSTSLERHLSSVAPDQASSALLVQEAVRNIFSVKKGGFLTADKFLRHSLELQERSIGWAWQAQIRVGLIAERCVDASEIRDEAHELATLAETEGRHNGLALALVAQCRAYIFRDFENAIRLAEEAVRLSPLQPLCWGFRALVNLYGGQVQVAYSSAQHALTLGRNSPHRFYLETILCMAAAIHGDYELAVKCGEAATAARPGFRPPIRFLVAAHTHLGNYEAGAAKLLDLMRYEPDFNIDALRDDTYPVLGGEAINTIVSGVKKLESRQI